jgi:hypothetical protein
MVGEFNGNAAGDVRRHIERHPNRRVPTWSCFFFLLTADSETSQGMRWDVAVHVVHVIYGQKSISSRSLEDSFRRRAARTDTSHSSLRRTLQKQQLYFYHIPSVEDVMLHDALVSAPSVNRLCNTRPETLHLQYKFLSRMNHTSLELGPPKLKTDTCDQKEPG